MRKIVLFTLVLFPLLANAQGRLVDKINEFKGRGGSFRNEPLFTNPTPDSAYRSKLADYSLFSVNAQTLRNIIQEWPDAIAISVPFKGQVITLSLLRTNPLASGFKVETDKGRFNNYQPGVYYRGIIMGDDTSIAVLNFFGDQCNGIVSSPALGNVNLGRLRTVGNTTRYIAYSDRDALFDRSFQCGTKENGTDALPATVASRTTLTTTHCVKFYYELAYDLYTDLGQDVTAATDWMIGLHNIASAVLENDGIDQTPLSEIFIWTMPDPFYPLYDVVLYSFPVLRPSFNGDLAILVKGQGFGGAALAVGELCQSASFAGPYARVGYEVEYEELPLYSWDVFSIAHEAGHALGSQHTHQCVWNGNNTPIDTCGSGFNLGEGLECYDPENPIIPELGTGTLMSYCPQAFSAGFGSQPAQRIINYINSAECLGSDCVSSCAPTLQGINVFQVGNNSARVYISDSDPQASQWLFRIAPNDFYTVTENSFLLTGLSNGLNHLEVRQICDAPYTATFTKDIYFAVSAADPVPTCGKTIVEYDADTTSPIQVLYPDEPGQMVSVHFDFIDCGTYMVRIFDGIGPWGEPAVSYYGNPTDIPDFTATNPTGALTVLYGGVGDFAMGFQAQVSCSALGTSEENTLPEMMVYPNPANGLVTIESTVLLEKISVTDMLGRRVLETFANGRETIIDISGWASGTYVLRAFAEGLEKTFKVIKR